MTSIVRTKFHKVRELIELDDVVMTSPGSGGAKHWSHFSHDDTKDMMLTFLDWTNEVPRFVIDPELMELTNQNEYMKSLADMKRANVLRLLFPVMWVELPGNIQGRHDIALLRDLAHKSLLPWEHEDMTKSQVMKSGAEAQFYSFVMRLRNDEGGTYLCVSPSIQYFGFLEKPEAEDENDRLWINVQSCSSNMFKDGPELDRLVKDTYFKDASLGYQAAFAAILMMTTTGVDREVIETKKINKKRLLSNREPIPRHTYIKIGRVYRYSSKGEVSDEYVPRRSPRPHWRRGHLKNVRFGIGKTSIKQVYINPKLVAYHEVGEDPSTPEYIVKA